MIRRPKFNIMINIFLTCIKGIWNLKKKCFCLVFNAIGNQFIVIYIHSYKLKGSFDSPDRNNFCITIHFMIFRFGLELVILIGFEVILKILFHNHHFYWQNYGRRNLLFSCLLPFIL